MDWESTGVEGFDLGPFPQGQTVIAKLRSAYNSLIIGCRGFGCETNLLAFLKLILLISYITYLQISCVINSGVTSHIFCVND